MNDKETIEITLRGKSHSEIALKEKLLDIAIENEEISEKLREALTIAALS